MTQLQVKGRRPPVKHVGGRSYVWVTVTPWCIANGVRGSLTRCPVALAIKLRMPHLAATVRVGSGHVYFIGSPRHSPYFESWLLDIIFRYDTKREDMPPFSFLLVLKDC